MNIKEVFVIGKQFAVKHLPTIVMGTGIAGFVTTVILTADRAPKAKEALFKVRKEAADSGKEPPTIIEEAKVVVPIVWPIAAAGAASMCCFIFANSMNLKRLGEAIAAYKLSENSFKSFKEAAVKTVGEKKTEEILDTQNRDALRANPIQNPAIYFGDGDYPCLDSKTKRVFKSNKNKIDAAENKINYMLLNEGSATQNDLYCFLGIEEVEDGGDFGWNLREMSDMLSIHTTPDVTADGTPCLAISYNLYPIKYCFE